jgi:hypothetical protein
MKRGSLIIIGKKSRVSGRGKTIRKINHKNGVVTLSAHEADKASVLFFSKKAKKSAKVTLLNAAVFNLTKKRILNSL